MNDWKIFLGDASPHDNLRQLPKPPPWRFSRPTRELVGPPGDIDLEWEAKRAAPFLPSPPMILAVNTALYLRRPLLITGQPGTGKSTLISKVAYELKLGRVLRWSISSRSTVRSGIYEYDAVGRLQAGKGVDPPVQDYLTLGALGTALMAEIWPRALLVDEIDKSDLDFANDLLNVIEEGTYEVPELCRLKEKEVPVKVKDSFGREVEIKNGRIECGQFPFVIMTSNAEREFPPPFLRRCIRLHVEPPDKRRLAEIVTSHLAQHSASMYMDAVLALIEEFDRHRKANKDVSTDQLLNAVFLTIAVPATYERSFSDKELNEVRDNLLQELSGITT